MHDFVRNITLVWNETCLHFKTRTLLCVEKNFQKMRLAQNLEVSTFRLYCKTRQTGGEKKTKFPIDAGPEGHNARMTDAVFRDTIKNIPWSIQMTEWNMASSFYAMEYSKTSESVKYPVTQNTLHTHTHTHRHTALYPTESLLQATVL